MSEDRIVRQHECMEHAIFVLTAVHMSAVDRVTGALADFTAAFSTDGPLAAAEPYVTRLRSFVPPGTDLECVAHFTETELMAVARTLWDLYRLVARAYYLAGGK